MFGSLEPFFVWFRRFVGCFDNRGVSWVDDVVGCVSRCKWGIDRPCIILRIGRCVYFSCRSYWRISLDGMCDLCVSSAQSISSECQRTARPYSTPAQLNTCCTKHDISSTMNFDLPINQLHVLVSRAEAVAVFSSPMQIAIEDIVFALSVCCACLCD